MISIESRVKKQMNSQGGRRPSIGRKLAIIAVLAVPFVILGNGAHAAPLLYFLRTNEVGGVNTSFDQYTTLADLAGGMSTGITTTINPGTFLFEYLFFDGVYYYKTRSLNGSSTDAIVRYNSYTDLATNTSGTQFGLSQGWDYDDDFWADGLGNYYRNSSPTSSVTQYPSFTDLVNGTNGSTNNYTDGTNSRTWGEDDRFFAYEGTFYRTNTSGGFVTGFVTYSSYANLLVDNSSGTIVSVGYSATDQFIAVPEPSAWVLGVCGVVPYFCCAARRSRQRRTTKR